MTEKQITTNLLNPSVWIRLVFMAIIALLLMVARVVIWVVALLQFLMVLIAGRDNDNLRNLGQGVSKWAYQGLLFLTFNSDEKPFPFSDWPTVEPTPGYEPEPYQTAEAPADAKDATTKADVVDAEVTTSEANSADVSSTETAATDGDDVPSFTDDNDDGTDTKKEP